jgi:hypothetical protein
MTLWVLTLELGSVHESPLAPPARPALVVTPVLCRRVLASTRGFELPTSSLGTQVRSVAAAYNDCLPTVRSPQDHQGTRVRLSTSSTAC